MTNKQKEIIWNLIERYDRVNVEFADALSRILRGIETSKDLGIIFSNYRKIDKTDEMTVDSVLGEKIMFGIL